MQITVTKIKTKDGDGKKGPWNLTKWTDENDIVWSTFDKKARSITVGTLVEILEWDTDEYGRDFQKFSVIAEATAESAAAAVATNGAAEREKTMSIERQSSAATILQFTATMKANGVVMTAEEYSNHDKAIAWLGSRFDGITADTTTDTRPLPADTTSDAAWNKMDSADPNGLDLTWAEGAASTLGWRTPKTLVSWLTAQKVTGITGVTIHDVFANIPHDRVELIKSAIETLIQKKGG